MTYKALPRTSKTPTPRAEALRAAQELHALIRDTCIRVVIAGSLRRGLDTVGDLELIAEPRIEARPADLFGTETISVSLLSERIDELVQGGTLEDRLSRTGVRARGERYSRLWFGDLPVDLFTPMPSAWGLHLMLRTGPASLSRAMVTPRAKQGLMPDDLVVQDGQVHRYEHSPAWHETRDGKPVTVRIASPGGIGPYCNPLRTEYEAEIFELWGLPWIEPRLRESLRGLSTRGVVSEIERIRIHLASRGTA